MKNTGIILLVLLSLVFAVPALCLSESSTSDNTVEKAKNLIQKKDFGQAIALLEAALRLSALTKESSIEALDLLSQSYWSTGAYDRALATIDWIRREAPAKAESYKLQYRALQCCLGKADWEAGGKLLERFDICFPKRAAFAHYTAGVAYQRNLKFPQAAKEYAIAIKKADKGKESLILDARERLMSCHMANESWDKAEALRVEIMRDHPEEAGKLHYLFGERYHLKQRYSEAISEYKQVTARDDSAADNYNRMALDRMMDCCLALGKEQEAQELFRQLEKKYPKSTSRLWYVVGRRRYLQESYMEAISALRKCVELSNDPRDPDVKNAKQLLVTAHKNTNNIKEHVAAIRVMLRDYPEETNRWLINLGWGLLEEGNYDEAILVLNRVINEFPASAVSAQTSLVECFSLMGKPEEGLAKLEEFYKDRPEKRPEYLLAYGQSLHYGPKRYEESVSVLQKLIKEYPAVNPQVTYAKRFLPKPLQELGRLDEAAAVIRELASAEAGIQNKVDLLARIGSMYFQAKKYRQAIDGYSEVLKVPNLSVESKAKALFYTGASYHHLGNHEDDAQHYMEAAKKHTESVWSKKAQDMLLAWSFIKGSPDLEGAEVVE